MGGSGYIACPVGWVDFDVFAHFDMHARWTLRFIKAIFKKLDFGPKDILGFPLKFVFSKSICRRRSDKYFKKNQNCKN